MQSVMPGDRTRRATLAATASTAAVAIAMAICGMFATPAGHAGDDAKASAAGVGPIRFRDVAADAGVLFRFETGARGKHDLVEIMGGGVGIIDFDNDGLPDIYLGNGGPIGDASGRPDPVCRLYRNRGGWRFEDVTDRAGAPGPSYAMGTAVGDYDGDGRDDLFVTGWRDQRLYRNLGGGKFEDVTKRAGLVSDAWSTAAAFADLDGDGDFDLYVATYLDYDPAHAPFCAAPDGKRDYCGPEDFPAQPDRLHRNNGDGTFTDVSVEAGIDLPEGRGLGVVIGEMTGDNRPDIYVANDSSACWLFANRGGLKFEEIGEETGVARDGDGGVISGMGVAHADLDGDGLLDLAVGNFFDRTTVAFRAQGMPRGVYRDASSWLGLRAATHRVTGFGLLVVDLDGDGRADLLQANGHVLDRERLGVPFAMRPTLLRGGQTPLEDVSHSAGPWFQKACLGRGLAAADLDGDGLPDVVACALDAPAAILRNESKGGRHLGVEPVDRTGRVAFGATIRVMTRDRIIAGSLDAGGSYLSTGQPRAWFGLGETQAPAAVEVDWPFGATEVWTHPKPETHGVLRLRQGTGRVIR
ncbi:MAG: CRTAC1 family protein [Isosphaeraceae bacterium]